MKYLAIIVLFILIFSSCSKKEEKNISMFEDNVSPSYNKKVINRQIRIAIAPILSPKSNLQYYNKFLNYIEKMLDVHIDVRSYKSYTDTNNAIKNAECDIAFVCTGSYLKGRDFMRILVVPQINGKSTYNSYVIVNVKTGIHNFDGLRNHSFAFTDPLSLSGYFYVVYKLKNNNTSLSRYFSKVVYTSSHDKSIELVTNGLIDGASVDSIIYDSLSISNVDIKKNTRIIDISPDFGIPPLVTRKDIDENIANKLVSILLDMHKTDEGKNILDSLNIDKFVLPDPSIYEKTNLFLNEIDN